MSSLKVKRITSYLEKHIKDRIDISDISRRPALEVEKATLSRSLAAGKSSVSCPLKPSDSAPLKHSTMPP